jgi:redox-sensitive bicupin YhaK (pirin superfamily)
LFAILCPGKNNGGSIGRYQKCHKSDREQTRGLGGAISVKIYGTGVRFLLVFGKRSIVMNMNEELRQVFDEYKNGTFVK